MHPVRARPWVHTLPDSRQPRTPRHDGTNPGQVPIADGVKNKGQVLWKRKTYLEREVFSRTLRSRELQTTASLHVKEPDWPWSVGRSVWSNREDVDLRAIATSDPCRSPKARLLSPAQERRLQSMLWKLHISMTMKAKSDVSCCCCELSLQCFLCCSAGWL